MKRIKGTLLFCALAMPLLLSCEKEKHNVHFHGRITAYCNDQFPAKFQTVSLHRYYDTGTTGSEWLGQTVTDENGYYSMITDVGQKGGFRSYILNIYGSTNILKREFSCHVESPNDTKDVEINAGAGPTKAYGFHIKNTSPVNNNDLFNSLITEFTYGNIYSHTLLENLNGMTVDTTIYRFYITYPVNYKYSFTKNGVFYEIPFDTVSNYTCLDTIMVEIPY